MAEWNWQLDGWIVVAGVLCAVSASLLGNFLVLRKLSLLGDAISHAILPGLAAAFFFTESRSSWAMFVGAVLVGILTVWLTEWTRSIGKVDEGAATGVVFTALFALGLIMIVRSADSVDLDPSCVLYGAIELTPLDQITWFGLTMPRVVWMLAAVSVVNFIAIMAFYKEFKITTFDAGLADSQGISAKFFHYLLASLVAVTSVAAFESVGNILVVAMFIVPPSTAMLLTNRLSMMIIISAAVAAASAVLGHWGAITVPTWFGLSSTNTAGMMAVVTGIFFGLATLLSPQHGILTRGLKQWWMAKQILLEDILAVLYRREEKSGEDWATAEDLVTLLLCRRWVIWWSTRWLNWTGYLAISGNELKLTERGRGRAQNLVRSHRLWESYLEKNVGLPGSKVHQRAERLEHFTNPAMRTNLDAETEQTPLDPHGRPIPPEI